MKASFIQKLKDIKDSIVNTFSSTHETEHKQPKQKDLWKLNEIYVATRLLSQISYGVRNINISQPDRINSLSSNRMEAYFPDRTHTSLQTVKVPVQTSKIENGLWFVEFTNGQYVDFFAGEEYIASSLDINLGFNIKKVVDEESLFVLSELLNADVIQSYTFNQIAEMCTDLKSYYKNSKQGYLDALNLQ